MTVMSRAASRTAPSDRALPTPAQEFVPGPLPTGHPRVSAPRLGVLLINLGTPDGTDYWSMRRYLREFLSDPRVIELNRFVWAVILHVIVLTRRPFTSGKAYKAIWNRELDESPLRMITRSQAVKLAERLSAYPQVTVDWAMRYGNPPIAARLRALAEQGCTRVLLVAAYPQYAASTTATAYDKAFDGLRTLRWQPAVRTAPPYYDDPVYIGALADSVRAHLRGLDWEPEVVLASFHGLPKRQLLAGDPYHCQCAKTLRLLREELGWDEQRLRLVFQSRFGSQEWLKPYTDVTVRELADQGVKRLAILTPGFSADCVETLEEIAQGAREIFEEHGGERFAFIPCLNDSEAGMDVIENLARREMEGWL